MFHYYFYYHLIVTKSIHHRSQCTVQNYWSSSFFFLFFFSKGYYRSLIAPAWIRPWIQCDIGLILDYNNRNWPLYCWDVGWFGIFNSFEAGIAKGPVKYAITHVQHTKKWRIWVSALWFAGRASKFVDDLTRTSDERYSFIVCVNLCPHFLHA